MRDCTKFGVPYHEYIVTLADGSCTTLDIGCEEDWGDIQRMVVSVDEHGHCVQSRVGLGNDADGHIEIVRVLDAETGEAIDPMKWAREKVWIWADAYAA